MRPALFLLLSLGIVGGCAGEGPRGTEGVNRQDMVLIPEGAHPVDRVAIRDLDSWRPVNRRMLVAGRRSPYLLVFARPCYALSRNEPIVLDSRDSYLRNNLGSIRVGGVPCALDGIYSLTKEQVSYLFEFFP